jgi:hypothetical protein
VVESQDTFEQFARTSGLQIATTPLNAAPRDLAAPADEHESYTLVELRRDGLESPLRVLFLSEASCTEPPSLRDVLWWLASDAWAIERGEWDATKWRSVLRYSTDSDASARLFNLHRSQTEMLSALLGEDAYRDLLAKYAAQLHRA